MNEQIQSIQQAADALRQIYPHPIKAAVVLGSGLGSFVDSLSQQCVKTPTFVPFEEVPNFPRQEGAGVAGHQGKWVFSEINNGLHLACLQGRLHYYQGYSMDQVVFPTRVLKALGCETLVVTNAAGGLGDGFQAGDLMLITDHLNLMGTNPLMGANLDELGPRFPDMSNAYDRDLQKVARSVYNEMDLQTRLMEGVYAGLTGPCYETPAEIRMMKTLGADAVGMSTVPEVIAANHMGMKVLGISCISNLAAGLSSQTLNHQEVLDTGKRVEADFSQLLSGILQKLSASAAV
ncbi:MAG: purine-nucleoside phosphorylase [Vampirovibrio sp.]|nr:purine-nucleoside phosphorylase [Vampirovibrio sp.]